MAKQTKKALCVLLSVVMAFSCFAINAFAFTGYDNNGVNNELRVQSEIAADKTAYQVGETVTATITLNHPEDAVLGYQAFIAFDASKLDFTGAQFANGFDFFDASSAPTADSVVELDTRDLHNGFGGTAYNGSTFAKLLGTPNFTNPAVVFIDGINLDGAAAGSTVIATVTFEAKAAVSSTGIALVPSNVYKSDFGFFDCVATLSSDGVYSSAFSATGSTRSFEITGASSTVEYKITFNWHDNTTTVDTPENTMPAAPEVPDYEDGDYHCVFNTWSPELAVATAATTYTAVYTRQFVSASYTAYDEAVAAAIAKIDNGTNWTDESLANLAAALNADVSGKGRTQQSVVNDQTAAIIAATEALEEKAAVYTINFEVNGTVVSSQQVTAGEMPAEPTVQDYEDSAKFYHFTGWDKEIAAAAGNTTYVAQFSETWKEYDIVFNWNGGSTTVKTHWNEMPEAPEVSDYETVTSRFKFIGWDPELAVCSGNTSYTAQYQETDKTYTIVFKDEDGTVLQSEDLAYGVTPSYKGATPTKAGNAQYTYTFAGWDKNIVAVNGDAVYTATYFSTLNNYEVKFVNDDGTELQKGNVAYGTVPTYNGETPTKAATNEYTFSFAGWDKEIVAVTGPVTYTATFTPKFIDYTITFYDEDGETVLRQQTLHWGDTPEAPSVPGYEKEGKTYTFAGWDKTVVAVAGDAQYVATYSSEFIVYTINFEVNGVIVDSQQVNAGFMPVAPEVKNYEDGDYDVTFTGWDNAVVPAAGDTTYTAQFSSAFVSANYDAVTEALAQADAKNKAIYTDDTVAVLEAAVNAVVENLGRTKQEQVNGYAQAILDAIAALKEKPADYSAYNAAVAALEEELAKADYTPDSIAAVRTKLTAIDEGLEKTLTITAQATVDAAKDAVNALVNELVEKADKGDLKSLIDEAQTLDSDKYVDFTAVTAALAEANTVYADENATPKAVSESIKSLRTALNALKFKDADYEAWDALEAQFKALTLRFYQQDLVDAVKTVLAKVEKGKDINYQPQLNQLTSELEEAINALDIVRQWEGEMDFNGEDHEYFGANLEFEKTSESNDELVVDVYLNHPNDKVSTVQVAALFDASIMQFQSVEAATEGQIIGIPAAAEARFDPTDYGYEAMGSAGVVKFIVEFDPALAETNAGRDHVATLHFKPIKSGETLLKAVPLASNTTEDKSIYSCFLDENYTEHFMHSEFVKAQFTGIINCENSIVPTNKTAVVGISLILDNLEVTSANTNAEGGKVFDQVEPGTYEVKFEARGSLGFTFKNVVVEEGKEIVIPRVELIFGNINGNDTIDLFDIASIIVVAAGNDTNDLADIDGNGVVQLFDITKTITNFGKTQASQVLVLGEDS